MISGSVYDKALKNQKGKNQNSEKRLDGKFLFTFKHLHVGFLTQTMPKVVDNPPYFDENWIIFEV